jgi:hypothetical protein
VRLLVGEREGEEGARLTRREEGRDCDCGIVFLSDPCVSLCDSCRLVVSTRMLKLQEAVRKVAKSAVMSVSDPESNPAKGASKVQANQSIAISRRATRVKKKHARLFQDS